MSLNDTIQAAINSAIRAYKDRITTTSLSFNDMLTLAYNATATFVRVVESLGDSLDGKTKKETVLLAIENFYDVVIRPISITGLPAYIENLVDDAIKKLVLTLASAWIDALVNIFAKLGWTKTPAELEKITEFPIF